MADLVYLTGPMDCGKSTLARQLDYTPTAAGRKGRLCTSQDRAGAAIISSRLGLTRPAVEVRRPSSSGISSSTASPAVIGPTTWATRRSSIPPRRWTSCWCGNRATHTARSVARASQLEPLPFERAEVLGDDL